MTELSISVCFWNYDRTIPLVDGRVPIDGCAPRFTILGPPENFPRTFAEAPFDVTEMSFSNYMTAFAAGRSQYTAIPVFLSRTFRHGSIFVKTDRGITGPRDLEGKTVGLVEYDMTAAVVVRGLLRDEYGVDTAAIRWRVGDAEAPVRETVPVPSLLGDVDVEPVPRGKVLNDMLAAGELDAMIAIEPPSCFVAGAPGVARLFPDWRATERAYYERTGVFPIMHAVGVRTALIAAHPWLPAALFDAFGKARRIALAELSVMNAPKVMLPWVAAELAATKTLMGADFWPYGVSQNRRVLEDLIRHSLEDGLTPRRLTVEELFAEATLGL